MSTASNAPLLSCNGLNIAVHECGLVQQLSLALHAGQVLAVLGRNGAGKSLTLHTLAGLRPKHSGSVQLQGQELAQLKRRRIAQQLSFVAQDSDEPFPVTVLECVLSGRHPHLDFWHWESTQDEQIAREALAAVDLADFAARRVDTLSGGERRRVAIATGLAQQTPLFILDEPTNHLDPQHQLLIMKLLRQRAEQGCAIIMSLHDPSLAARFTSHSLLLFGNGEWRFGSNSELLTAEVLQSLYRTPILPMHTAVGAHFTFL